MDTDETWELAAAKYWQHVRALLSDNSHTRGKEQALIARYKKQLEDKGIDLGLVYHRDPAATAIAVAQAEEPGAVLAFHISA